MLSSQTLLCNPTSIVPLLGTGQEFPQSRRRNDFYTGRDYPASVRSQYEGGALADLAVRIEFSIDNGASWWTLVPEGASIAVGVTILTPWQVIPQMAAGMADVLLRAVAVGGAILAATVFYVELQVRP